MKRIFYTVFAVALSLAFAPVVCAQPGQWSINGQIHETETDPETHVTTTKYLEWPKAAQNGLQQPEGTDFAYSKDISAPQSDGTYWIKLESFSTGAATRILSSTPSDVILILDSSSSMSKQDYGLPDNNPRASQDYTYNNIYLTYGQTSYAAYYYKHTDGKYYLVNRRQSGNTRYLYFTTDEDETYYLYGTGITQTAQGRNSATATIWSGVLYEQITRIKALQDATNKFIDNIYQNDADVTAATHGSFAGNRIAIVTFDNSAHVLTTNGWVDVGTGVDNLKSAVDNMSLANYTQPALGISSAISNFLAGTGETHRKRAEANLTVVLFTDGVPAQQSTGGQGDQFDATLANQAIYQGHLLKDTYGATVYTVGLLDRNSTDEHVKRGIYFLDLLSSNYPDSTIPQNSTSAWNISGNTITVQNLTTGTKDPDGDYFKLVDGDLTKIFEEISQQSGGSSSNLSAASRNVDVVSNSFIIPHTTSETEAQIAAKVQIFIAKVTGYDSTKKEFIFAEEILKGHLPDNPEDVVDGYYYYPLDEHGAVIEPKVLTKADSGVGVAYSATTQAVTVTGFDYSSMFCGPVYYENYTPSEGPEMTADDLANVEYWQGYKIIIMIPIEMNPDAVGGPDVATNGAGSGIFIDNNDEVGLVRFKSPTVSLPVNIHLKKTGLGPGESAKFRIDRAQLPDPIPEGFDPSTLENWSYVSTVFVTRPEGSADTDPAPVVKVRGLPANMDDEETSTHKSFVYRITEEDWSWSYNPDTPPQYTTTQDITNPFTFSNTKEDNIDVKVRHAESKATNVFKPGIVTNNVKYDDSKTNNRE